MAEIQTVSVIAPSRLHFGLFSFGGTGRQFGGVGAMLERPCLELCAKRAASFSAIGPLAERVRNFAQRWSDFHHHPKLPPYAIEIISTPPEHVGLGVGTQLGMSVAAALQTLSSEARVTAAELALQVGRGQRSAIGTYGFGNGGLLVESGKLPHDRLSPLDCRLELNAAWRFVLLRSQVPAGLAGSDEQSAFAKLPPVPEMVRERLIALVRERMLPAAVQSDFMKFSESVYDFGYEAGMCFASVQGGAYNGPVLQRLVDQVRSLGVRGVGQSSWGPTVFALLANQADAETFAKTISRDFRDGPLQIEISAPNNCGARVTSTS